MVCLQVVPSIGKFVALLAAGLALLTGALGWLAAAVVVTVLALTVELVAAAWSRDREYTIDAIAAHVLGVGLDADMTRALAARHPGSAETDLFASHPGWADRHAALVVHAERLGGTWRRGAPAAEEAGR